MSPVLNWASHRKLSMMPGPGGSGWAFSVMLEFSSLAILLRRESVAAVLRPIALLRS
jgi:hypothetical protein